ncbi:MAG: A/G-specific adenine glycosylase [Flavobacteriales bacterium]|nr:A/G-specific adenine glycosylase [Flavobacteriales bacterium]
MLLNFDHLKSKGGINTFPSTKLLDWYEGIKRDLPWRETKDPYKVWISEIILQQTRVDQGLPYYQRFITRFPKVEDLANAKEDEVLKVWEGLGYYSRARNLHFTAKLVVNELGGIFPNTYKGLLELKGVGSYTAAAIGSISFGLPVAAVDGNVYRVLSRYFGILESIDETVTKKMIAELANEVLAKQHPGNHNQAMMELGATVCSPTNPTCDECPLNVSCQAKAENLQSEIPVRSKKTKVRDRFFYYSVIILDDEVFISRRVSGDIWQGLYEFPLLETESRIDESDILDRLNLKQEDVVLGVSQEFKHILSHQRIFAKFILIKSDSFESSDFIQVKKEKLKDFAFPRLINRYLEKQTLVIVEEV